MEDEKMKKKILEMIEKLHLDNPRLIKALDNDLFLKIIYEIVNLPYGLHLVDKLHQGSPETMWAMIRFEYTTRSGGKSIVWVYFPTSPTSKSIQCRLQKRAYSSNKVKQPKTSDNHGYPYTIVHNEEDIEDLISCINEYMNKGMGVNPLNII